MNINKEYFWADRSYENPQDCKTIIEYLCECIANEQSKGTSFPIICVEIVKAVYSSKNDDN